MPDPNPHIHVLAGVNGGGKTSLKGRSFNERGVPYFNPDEATKQILLTYPLMSQSDANIAAWHQGVRLLEVAIEDRLDFAFETTLGGKTITAKLKTAISRAIKVSIWYVGLRDIDLHIERVRARVARGGHSVSDKKIRERYYTSRSNLIALMPHLSELFVYDNSTEVDVDACQQPNPNLVLRIIEGHVEFCEENHPGWADPIVKAAMKMR